MGPGGGGAAVTSTTTVTGGHTLGDRRPPSLPLRLSGYELAGLKSPEGGGKVRAAVGRRGRGCRSQWLWKLRLRRRTSPPARPPGYWQDRPESPVREEGKEEGRRRSRPSLRNRSELLRELDRPSHRHERDARAGA